MALIGVTGNMGAGKSLTGVLFTFDDYRAGRPTMSNGPLCFPAQPGCVPPVRASTWEQVVSFRNGTFLWDESHLDIDSREFSKNVDVTGWLTQIRKMGVNLIYITQSWDQVDKRIRNLTDMLIQCEKVEDASGRRGTRILSVDVVRARLTSKSLLWHEPWMYSLYNTRAPVLPLEGKIPPLRVVYADLLGGAGL